jgi:hypothetical protein
MFRAIKCVPRQFLSTRRSIVAHSLTEAIQFGSALQELILKPNSNELTCVNMMCEKLGDPCICKLGRCLSRTPNLKRLEIAGHNLVALPESIGELSQLTHLDISGKF